MFHDFFQASQETWHKTHNLALGVTPTKATSKLTTALDCVFVPPVPVLLNLKKNDVKSNPQKLKA